MIITDCDGDETMSDVRSYFFCIHNYIRIHRCTHTEYYIQGDEEEEDGHGTHGSEEVIQAEVE